LEDSARLRRGTRLNLDLRLHPQVTEADVPRCLPGGLDPLLTGPNLAAAAGVVLQTLTDFCLHALELASFQRAGLLDREVAGPVVVWMAAPADAALTPVDGLKDALRSGLAVTKAGVVHERDRGMDSLRPRPDFATAAHVIFDARAAVCRHALRLAALQSGIIADLKIVS